MSQERFKQAITVYHSYLNSGGYSYLADIVREIASSYSDISVSVRTGEDMYGNSQVLIRLLVESKNGLLFHRNITMAVPAFGDFDESPRITLFTSVGYVPFENHYLDKPYSAPMVLNAHPPCRESILRMALESSFDNFRWCVYGYDLLNI